MNMQRLAHIFIYGPESYSETIAGQAKVQEEAGLVTGDDAALTPGEEGSREEADARSIYVGNVDYACTPEELQVHFQVRLMAAGQYYASRLYTCGVSEVPCRSPCSHAGLSTA